VEDATEQFARHRHLGHLEHEIAAVGDDLRPDPHDLLAQAGQGPLRDFSLRNMKPVFAPRPYRRWSVRPRSTTRGWRPAALSHLYPIYRPMTQTQTFRQLV